MIICTYIVKNKYSNKFGTKPKKTTQNRQSILKHVSSHSAL